MNLLPLADYLAANGYGTEATTIFVNQMPIECKSGILLRNRLQGTLIDHELPGYYKTRFQLVIRATGYAVGESQIESVISALTVAETQVGTMYFKFMRPMSLPVVFPISKGNLLEFAVDMEVAFVM